MKVAKIRPQILAAIVLLGAIGIVAMCLGFTEVATACPAGIVALGMNLIDEKNEK